MMVSSTFVSRVVEQLGWTRVWSFQRQQARRLKRRRGIEVATIDALESRLAPAAAWSPIGGKGITNGQVEGMPAQNDPVTGAIQVVLPHPTNADILYVGGVNGGVWKTTNAQAATPTWTTNTDQMASLSIGALAFDSADSTLNTVWAGSGRNSSLFRSGGEHVGLYRTTDGGDTWSTFSGGGVLTGKRISGIAANGNTIVVAAANDDSQGARGGGIYRSTDGGATFARVGGALPAGSAYDLVRDPVSTNVLYTGIAFAHLSGGTSGVYRSADMGATWTKVSSTAMDAHVAASQSISNIEMAVGRTGEVYAAFLVQGRLAGLYRSPDGTTSWTQLDSPATNENGTNVGLNPRAGGKGPGDLDGSGTIEAGEAAGIAGGQGSIHFSIAADPTNSNIVYVGGDRQPGPGEGPLSWPNSIGASDYSGRLFRVDASQATGSQASTITHRIGISTTRNSAPHADSRDMAFDSAGNLIESDDGGVYKRTSPRGLGDWESLIGNLQMTEFHSLQYDSASNRVIGGAQDTGTPYQSDANGAFDSLHTGDGGVVAIDTLTTGQSTRYTSFQNLGAFRRTVWNSSGTLISTAFPALNPGSSARLSPQFYTPIQVNSVQPGGIAFAAANGVYISSNGGDSISLVAGGPSFGTAIAFGGTQGGVANPDVLYVGDFSGLFVRTTTAGSLTQSVNYPGNGVTDIVLDPTDWRTAYVTDDNGVYRTTDAGVSWTTLTGSLNGNTIRTIEFMTGVDNAIVVGDLTGVYRMFLVEPGSWTEFAPNLPNAPVWDLDFSDSDKTLVASVQGRGAWTITDTTSVTQRNRPPVIATTSLPSIAEGTANGISVGTVVATDPDNNTLTWTITGGNTNNAFTINTATGEISVANSTALDFETSPTFSLTIQVTDDGQPNLSTTGTVTIGLTNVNEPPTGVTLTPSRVNEGIAPSSLVGILSANDPDTTETHTFTLISGLNDRDNFRFQIVGNQLIALQTVNYEVTPVAFIMVRVTDSANVSFDATLQIIVNDINEVPTDITLAPQSISENAGANAVVGSLGAVDEDRNETFVYTFVSGAGSTNNSDFTIVGSTLRTTRSFDFETEPTRSIRVRVTDRGGLGLSYEKQFTINVTNLNEAPTDIFLDNVTVVEDVASAEVGLLSATDPDVPSTFTFTLVSGVGSTDNSQFTIVGNSLRTSATGIDFEAGATRSIRIRVSDGLNSYEEAFIISILDTNEELTISSLSVAENLPIGSLVGTLSTIAGVSPYTYTLVAGEGDDDNASFSTSGNQLFTNAVFNFEAKREYFVRLRSTSTGGTPVFERAFRVIVTDANDAPTNVTLSNNSIPENSPNQTTVGTLAAVDEDAGQTFTFTLPAGVDNNSEFTIVGNSLRATQAYNFEAVTTRTVTVRATDSGSPAKFFDRQFTINITNVNEPPTTITFQTGGTVPENQAGALVGRIITDDPDAGETFTYRLYPQDQSVPNPPQDDSYLFVVQGDQVFVGPTRLDYETKRNLVIWVRATDSGGYSLQIPVPITVLNVNDTPEAIGLTGDTVTENVTGNRLVGTFNSIDVDAIGSYTYTLVSGTGATDNASFSISGNQLRTSAVFNFEAKSQYSIRVRTTDVGGLSADRVFTIRVLNVDEAPFGLAFARVDVPENSAAGTLAGTFTATDPESGPLTFSLVAGDGDTGNSHFVFDGGTLRTTHPLDYETAPLHTIRVRVTDGGAQIQEGAFVVNVLDRTDPTRFYRAYNRRGEYHFYTTNKAEFEAVLRGPGFRDETTGQSGFNVLGDSTTGAFPIFRVFNFQTQRHYYTTNALERDSLLNLVTPSNPLYGQIGWRYEKDEGFIFANPAPGTVPIFRLYNNRTGVHLYTEASTVRDAVLRQFPGIWESHGILGYAFPLVVVAPTSSAAATEAPTFSSAVTALGEAGITLNPAAVSASTGATNADPVASGNRLDTLVGMTASPVSVPAAPAEDGSTEPDDSPRAADLVDSSSTSTIDDLFASPLGLGGFGELLP